MDKRSKYYLDRFTKQEDGINKLTVKKEAALKRIYRDAKKELESDLAVFLEKYSRANKLESADLKRMLNTKEIAKFRYDIKGYVDEIERLGKDTLEGKALKKELDIMAGRTRVSRVEALRTGIEHELNKVAIKSSDTIKNHLSGVVDETYSEVFKIIRGNTMAKLDTKLIKRIVGQKWDSKNYSQRVWQNRRGLADKVMKTITSGIMQGHDFDRMVDGLRKNVAVGYYEARRLMHTETTFALERAKGEAFKDMGVKKYRFVAVMDRDTSEICRNLNGQEFEMKDRQIGINCPAMHPFCRSVTVPVLEVKKDKIIEQNKIRRTHPATEVIPSVRV